MLKGKLIHPQLMAALSACGHGDKILIADGNYPLDSKTTDAELIYLGLTPGLPTVTDVLDAILSASNVEKAQVMTPGEGRFWYESKFGKPIPANPVYLYGVSPNGKKANPYP